MEISKSDQNDNQEIAAISELEFIDTFVVEDKSFPRLSVNAAKCPELNQMIAETILYFEGPNGGQHILYREAEYPRENIIDLYKRSWERLISPTLDFQFLFKDICRRNRIRYNIKMYNEFTRLIFERCNFAEYLPKDQWPKS